MSQKPLISVVSPCYNEEKSVEECYQAVKNVFEKSLPDYEWEHIFSDNSSTDQTVPILRKICERDPHVKVIVNARNFGAFRSMFNALMKTRGDGVIVMLAVDLQDPPEVIEEMALKWKEGYQVVYGIRMNRKEGIFMRMARSIFYYLVASSSDVQIPIGAGEFQLIDRKVVEALRGCKDYFPYVRGLIANAGFRSIGIPYDWGVRRHGKSNANFFQLYDQAVNGLISFTNLPMRISVFLGVLLASISLLVAILSVFMALVYPELSPPHGITTIVVILLFFSGVQLLFIGVIGEYVAATHSQVRQGFYVTEEELINFDQPVEKVSIHD